jgi:hypothetical protein
MEAAIGDQPDAVPLRRRESGGRGRILPPITLLVRFTTHPGSGRRRP